MFNNIKNNDFANVVGGRRSIRLYDPEVKISDAEMTEMLEEAFRAPSSVNFQPWRVVVVESASGKEKLEPLIRFNTRQNETSSAMLLIFGDLEADEYGEKIYGKAVAEGKMTEEVKNQQLAAIKEMYSQLSRQERSDIAKIDGGLMAMQLMLVARAHGYDTNPIGGFEQDKLAESFGLDPNRYVPVMIVAIGKAAEEGYDSVRLGTGDFVEKV